MEKVIELSEKDARKVHAELIRFNRSAIPFTQRKPFIRLRYGIRANDGALKAGITATLYCWGILYVDALWVDEQHRHRGLGAKLIAKLEKKAKRMGCTLSHLDTFDFQAKEFYEKVGYEIFGILDECPPGHKRYFLKKVV